MGEVLRPSQTITTTTITLLMPMDYSSLACLPATHNILQLFSLCVYLDGKISDPRMPSWLPSSWIDCGRYLASSLGAEIRRSMHFSPYKGGCILSYKASILLVFYSCDACRRSQAALLPYVPCAHEKSVPASPPGPYDIITPFTMLSG